MAVKDYLQALQGESMINSDKIGNCSWYWSFPSEIKKAKEKVLAEAQENFDKASATTVELQTKVGQAGAARAEDEGLLAETGALYAACKVLFRDTDRWRPKGTGQEARRAHPTSRSASQRACHIQRT